METNRLYVGNLSYDTTEESLREAFSAHGTVVSTVVIGRKGFGFVEMDSKESAQKAKDALDGTELEGRTIRVDAARPRRDEAAGDSGDSQE